MRHEGRDQRISLPSRSPAQDASSPRQTTQTKAGAPGRERSYRDTKAKDPIAATYGLSFYSDAFPIEAGKRYRVTVAYRGSGGAKVWVRGYGLKAGKERRLYEAQGACPSSPDGWTDYTHEFHPTKNTPAVTTMKVMLFAYWPPGQSWFDDVRVEALPPE